MDPVTQKIKTLKPTCPHCRKMLDGFTAIEHDNLPVQVMYLCVYCSTVLEFTDNLSLDFVSAESLAEIDLPALQHAHRAVVDFQKIRGM